MAKSLTIVGAGAGATKIVNGGTTVLVDIALTSDVPVRISGIYFDNVENTRTTKTAIQISGKRDGSYGLTQVRISENTFDKGKRTVYATGWVCGVVDNNTFKNCDIAVGVTGDNNHSWSRPILAGTPDALFIEDNVFLVNNEAEYEPNEQIYHQEGARTVVRWNVFDGTAYTAGNFVPFDSHGNQNYYVGTSSDFRGQPLIEVYNNSFSAYKTYRFFHIRGGSAIIFANTLTTVIGSATAIELTDEESWQTAFFSPFATVWAAQDQIMNCFIWGNNLNGTPITSVHLKTANDAVFIQLNRDYFMHAPEGTGGKATYTGRPGGTEAFTASGPNAYYPYVSYTYPHPLRNGSTSMVQPPRGLRLNN